MQISTKFTIAIHMLAGIEYLSQSEVVTSKTLAASIGSNPVIIRNLMADLRRAGLIVTKRGPGRIKLAKPVNEITYYDVYVAVEKNKEELFNFHQEMNLNCPVGKNIHGALIDDLNEIQQHFEDDLKNYLVSDVVAKIAQANA